MPRMRKAYTIAMTAATLMAGIVADASAQDRMPPIPQDRMTEAQRAAVAEFKAARSADISGPFVPPLRSCFVYCVKTGASVAILPIAACSS